MSGYMKLWRSMLDWEWYADHNACRLFIHLLLTVKWREENYRGLVLYPGQRSTSVDALVKETGISPRSIRTSLNRLVSTGELTIKTTNKYTLITVVNWASYQSQEDETTNKTTSNLTNERQTNDKQVTTIKEYKKGRMRRRKEIDIVYSETKTPYGKSNNVLLGDREYNDLISEYGKTVAELGIEKVSGMFAQYPKSGYTNKSHVNAVRAKLEKLGYEKLKPQIEIPQIDSPEQQEINRAKVAEALAKGLGLK